MKESKRQRHDDKGRILGIRLDLEAEISAHVQYRGIERVRSRTLVTIDGNGCRQRRYWAPDLDAVSPYSNEQDQIERARELLDLAVAASTRDTAHIAIATSGGFDSSAIAATAPRLGAAKSIACFCLVPPPGTTIDVGAMRYFDERSKVEDLARMHPGLDVHFVAPDRMHPKAEPVACLDGRLSSILRLLNPITDRR